MTIQLANKTKKTLQEGVPWNWTSFGSYLDCLDNKMAVNIGFLVGHSALRRVVMGEDSNKTATAQQITTMKALLSKSLAEGGMGFPPLNLPPTMTAVVTPCPHERRVMRSWSS